MAVKINGYLKVPDIPGPAKRDGHDKEIMVYRVDFNMHAPYDSNSLSRRGGVEMDMVVFTKQYDMSDPYLKKALFDNTKFGEVKFSAVRTIDKKTSDYLVVTMTDATVMSYRVHPSADEQDVLESEVGFAYHKIKFTYDKDHEIEMDVQVGT